MSTQREEDNDNNHDDGGGCGCCACCNDTALKINTTIEKAFCAVGYLIGQWPYIVLGLVLLFLGLCCFGFLFTEIETNIFNLWTPTDSDVFKEEQFIDFYWADSNYGLLVISGVSKDGVDTNVMTEDYMEQWYQIHLDFANNLPKKQYEYIASDNSIQYLTFGYFAENYNEPEQDLTALKNAALAGEGPTSYASEVIPLCRSVTQSPAEAQFIMPCYLLTVLDCFSEGGYFFPYENYLQKTLLSGLVPANPYTYRDSFAGKSGIELGEILGPSCSIFTGTKAPSNYIYGGETRVDPSNETSNIIDLKSYQIIAFVDSPSSVARKIKIATGECLYTSTYGISCPEITDEELEDATEFVNEWLSDYIDYMETYTKELNADDSKLWNLVFWTPRTSGDLLREASSADFGLLAIAYVAMIIFASLTAINFSDWFLSRSEASFAGVLLVLFAVLATIGLGSFCGIPLSPNVVQVLPFIALGFGVDDMFVLLFSFKYREHLSVEEMISETTRIAGSSVALTSLANFFGFFIGTFMVLPDVARFATYGTIIVLLNFIAIIFGFTAILSLTARRMKNGYNDWSFLCLYATFTTANNTSSEKPSAQSASIFDPLFDWLTKTYTRVVMVVIFITLIIVGGYGCTLISPGLPLPDIVPSNTYASEFLRIREMFYFSYIVNLYTDAKGSEYKPIDWQNKFAEWIEETEDIFTISDTIYQDPGVHDFWAWGLRDYLQEKYAESLTMEYALGETFDIEAALADDPVYQGWQCNADAAMYCSSNQRLYVYQSPLYNCLAVNRELGTLSDACSQWVYDVGLANFDTGVAKQIYIQSFVSGGMDVGGLYLRPSTAESKVYIKEDGMGYIYQESCDEVDCQWYLLDDAFNVRYIGESTSVTDSESPAQNGWRDLDMKPVEISHIYYDFTVQYFGSTRDLSIFRTTDYTINSNFEFSAMYEATTDTNATCKQWEVMRLLMTDYDAFSRIAMSTDNATGPAGIYDVTCDAILESSQMCGGIRDAAELGAVTCGTLESPVWSAWYLGTDSNDGLYQIVSSPNVIGTNDSITSDIFNNCADPDQWMTDDDDMVYNYLKPCGTADNFGGFGISANNASTTMCNADDQEISLQCDAMTDCTDLRVCYNDIAQLSVSAPTDCNAATIALYQTDTSITAPLIFAPCLFRHYDELTSCCQTAVNTLVSPSGLALQCSAIEGIFDTADADQASDLQSVCQQKNECEYANNGTISSCTQVSGGSTFADCALLIYSACNPDALGMTADMIRQGNQQAFAYCIGVGASQSFSDLCESTYNTEVITYANCLYPVPTFWDFETESYDYSMCTEAEINATICGMPSNYNTTELECLQENVDDLPDGCCKRAIEQIMTVTYSFTNDCEGDVIEYCAPVIGSLYASAGTVAALNEQNYCIDGVGCPGEICMDVLKSAALSPKCTLALGFCEAVDDWPLTLAGISASIPCGEGYTGMQTRTCDGSDVPVVWGEIDRTECALLTCPETLAADNMYNQYWPETPIDSVYKIQGGLINTVPPMNSYTDTQVSAELIGASGIQCNPAEYNVYYARRKCQLDPYNTSQAIWAEPIVECKPFISLWIEQPQTVCDFVTEPVVAEFAAGVDSAAATPPFNTDFFSYLQGSLQSTPHANLIDAILWDIYDAEFNGGVSTDRATQIDLSQTYCTSLLTNCAAFTYDELLKITYFFDYCPTLNNADFNGSITDILESPAWDNGPPSGMDLVAGGISQQVSEELGFPVTLTKEDVTQWSFIDDIIMSVLLPEGSPIPKMTDFASRHTTYISPLNSVEFTAQYCSTKTFSAIYAAVLGGQDYDINSFIAPTEAWDENGIPDPFCFNNTLWLYFIDPTGGVLFRDKIVFVDPTQVTNTTGFDNVQILSTFNSIQVRDINDDEVAVQLINELRDRLQDWADNHQLYAIPGGLVIDLFSQYIGINESLIFNLIYVSIAIVLCGLIFLLNPIAVFIALLCNTAMIVEVYGFADWFGLRLNGVLVLNIVIAVALTMEFTAHIGRAFVLSNVTSKDRTSSIALPFSSDGQIRMKKTLREMFTPVSLGALTTLIGVSPIAAAQFPYFRQYYFTLYVMIVLFGWLNGVIFQVVILSFLAKWIEPFSMAHSSTVNSGAPQQQQQNNPNSSGQSLAAHVELQEAGSKSQEPQEIDTDSEPNEDGNKTTKGDNLQDPEVKAEVIARKHTRTDQEAP